MNNWLGSTFKYVGAVIAGIAAFIWGPADEWLWALIAMMALDYISGVAAACVNRELSSRIGFKGICKKALLLVILGAANIADGLVNMNGTGKIAVTGFLIANEGLSILENCNRCGLEKPSVLINLLKQLKGNDEDDN